MFEQKQAFYAKRGPKTAGPEIFPGYFEIRFAQIARREGHVRVELLRYFAFGESQPGNQRFMQAGLYFLKREVIHNLHKEHPGREAIKTLEGNIKSDLPGRKFLQAPEHSLLI